VIEWFLGLSVLGKLIVVVGAAPLLSILIYLTFYTATFGILSASNAARQQNKHSGEDRSNGEGKDESA
jgi:hypothetical protein